MPSNGWLVALFHQVRVTLAVVLAPLELVALLALPAPAAGLELLEELPLLHAAAAVAVVTASATAASARLLRMWSPDRGIGAKTHSRKFSEHFRRAVIVKTADPGVNPPFPSCYRYFHTCAIAVRCCENSPEQRIQAGRNVSR